MATHFRTLILSFVALLLCAPFAWMLSLSLRAPGTPLPAHLFEFQQAPTFSAFAQVFAWVPMATGLINSLLITGISVLITVLSASLTGFGLTRLNVQRQRQGLMLLIFCASVPLTAIALPRFVVLKTLGLAGGAAPLLLPALYGLSPLFVLLFFVAFKRLDADAFDAAILEGASPLWLWWRAALPQVRASVVAIACLAAIQSWGAFLEPLLYLDRPQQQTAPLFLHALEMLGSTQWSTLMAGAVLVTLPLLLLIAASQGLFSGFSGARKP